jgi:hypothetical protein
VPLLVYVKETDLIRVGSVVFMVDYLTDSTRLPLDGSDYPSQSVI